MQQGEIAKLIWSMQADLARALPKALTQTSVQAKKAQAMTFRVAIRLTTRVLLDKSGFGNFTTCYFIT